MSARARLAAAAAYLWDNPTAEQEARSMLAAHKVGLWLGLEALAIGAASAASLLLGAQHDRAVREAVVTLGTGPFLTFVALGVVALFLTLFVPLRAVGLLEGPRWRGYLDQLVTTGITPLRYHAGKWAACQPFFLALLGASLPFVTLFGLLGGASVGRTLLAYVLLYAYANLLLLVTMALGVLLHEVLALLLAWGLFAAMVLVDLTPMPSTLACLTPVRFLIQPLVPAMSGAWASTAERLYGDPRPFGLELPWPLWALGVWAALGLLAAVTLVVGPLQGRPPGLNTFGLVVLPGDARRAFFRRVRPLLVRRVELAFLFENRGPRLTRLILPLRWLQQVGLALLFAALTLSAVFDPDTVAGMGYSASLVAFAQLACGAALVLPLVGMGGGWPQASVRWPAGGANLGPAAMDVAAFLVVAAGVIALHTLGFTGAWEAVAALEPLPDPRDRAAPGWSSPAATFATSSGVLVTLVATALVALLTIKATAARSLGAERSLIGAALFMGGLVFLPLIAATISVELARHDELGGAHPLAAAGFFVGLMSPATHIAVVTNGVPPELPHAATSGLLAHGFWLWQAGLVLLLGGQAWAGHRALGREAAALERLGDPSPPAAPPADPFAPLPAAPEGLVAKKPTQAFAKRGFTGTIMGTMVFLAQSKKIPLGVKIGVPLLLVLGAVAGTMVFLEMRGRDEAAAALSAALALPPAEALERVRAIDLARLDAEPRAR
ncbi:MAG: hypothetical protein KF878_36440, partial [Planctomycetes bacterium]|nr:hypothetical protein [Planctomycetota bacterium]